MSSDNVELLSYTSNLNASALVETPKVILGQYISLNVLVKSDQDLSIILKFSGDGRNFDYSLTNNVYAGENKIISTPVVGKWLKMSIQNTGSVATTYLRVYVYGTPSNSAISAQIGKIGNLDPSIQVSNLPRGIFGGLVTHEPTPMEQYIFSKGNSGNLNTGTWKLPYCDVRGYCSQALINLTIGDGVARFGNGLVQGGAAPYNRACLYGSAVRYRPGQGISATYTAYFTQPSNTPGPMIQYVGIGQVDTSTYDVVDGYFFGYGDSTAGTPNQATNFGIVYYRNGTRSFYPRSSWNVDKADGNYLLPVLNFSYSNIFRIEYQYLGFGIVKFSVVNPNDGLFYTVHTIQRLSVVKYPTNLSDPTLGFLMYATYEVGGFPVTTDGEIGVGSFITSVQGTVVPPAERIAVTGSKTVLVETAVLNIRCDTTFYASQNNYSLELDFISVACEGTKPVTFKIYSDSVLGGVPVWTVANAYITPLSYDTAGTLSTGTSIYSFSLGKSDNAQIVLDNLHTYLTPGKIITITATSTANSDVIVSASLHIR